MDKLTELTGKFELAMKLALRRGRKGCLAIVDVRDPREAEMILELASAVRGRESARLRERIHAIALLEPSGFHLKRVDTDWEPLEELSAPAVLLCPSGIISMVLADDRCKYRYVTVSRESSWGDRGCTIGCLILIAIVVVWIAVSMLIERVG